MNHDNSLPSPENDPLVSAEYHTLSTEITPTALDEVVLEQARAATKNSWLRKSPSLWFRPMVFTATLGLTLMLLLELTTTPESNPSLTQILMLEGYSLMCQSAMSAHHLDFPSPERTRSHDLKK